MADEIMRIIGRLQAERGALTDFLLSLSEKLVQQRSPEADRILDYLTRILPG